ncbi:hypothetical protein L7F22_041641 [Adiantum nelumboides]|nr:hypothetical protein [Adiantum nelumboides]
MDSQRGPRWKRLGGMDFGGADGPLPASIGRARTGIAQDTFWSSQGRRRRRPFPSDAVLNHKSILGSGMLTRLCLTGLDLSRDSANAQVHHQPAAAAQADGPRCHPPNAGQRLQGGARGQAVDDVQGAEGAVRRLRHEDPLRWWSLDWFRSHLRLARLDELRAPTPSRQEGPRRQGREALEEAAQGEEEPRQE